MSDHVTNCQCPQCQTTYTPISQTVPTNPRPTTLEIVQGWYDNVPLCMSRTQAVDHIALLIDRERTAAVETARPAIEQAARVELLNSIVGSLLGFPNCGGDIGIMAEVERIVREAKIETLNQLRPYLRHMPWCAADDGDSGCACGLTAELVRLEKEKK